MKLFFILLISASCAVNPSHAKVARQSPSAKTRRVVLVHGFREYVPSFFTMKRRLEKQGFECYVPRLLHPDGRGGLENLAMHLKQGIDKRFGDKEPISIVAFSMGGLVSRYYLQELGGSQRCANFITVATPHHGTKAAWLYPSKGAQQMRPGSRFLTELNQSQDQLGNIPITSYRTRLDLVILPTESSIWDHAENLEHPSLFHPLLLHSNPVISGIEQRLSRGN